VLRHGLDNPKAAVQARSGVPASLFSSITSPVEEEMNLTTVEARRRHALTVTATVSVTVSVTVSMTVPTTVPLRCLFEVRPMQHMSASISEEDRLDGVITTGSMPLEHRIHRAVRID